MINPLAHFLELHRRRNTHADPTSPAVQGELDWYKVLFERSRDAVFLADFKGKFLDANQAAFDLLRYKREDLGRLSFASLLSADQLPAALGAVAEIIAKGSQHAPTEFRLRRSDGSQIFLETLATLLYRNDKPFAILGIARDLTERKRTESVILAQRDLAKAIGRLKNLDEGLDLALSTALKVSGLDSGGIYLFNQENTALELVSHRGMGNEFAKATSRYSMETENVTLVQSGQTRYFTRDMLSHSPAYMAEDIKSVCSLPVSYREQVIGCINLASHQIEAIPISVREVLETIAAEIGNLIGYMRSSTALQLSENRNRTLVDAIPDMIFRLSGDGTFLDYHARKDQLFAQPTDFIGKSISEVLPADVAKLCMASIHAARAGDFPTFELWLPMSGASRYYEARVAADKHTGESVFVVRDITDRKAADESLRASRERYKGIFEDSVAAIYIFDQQKHFRDSNQAGLDLLGYTREELLRLSIPDVDANPQVVLPAHGQLLAGERLINYEHKLRRKDRSVITVLNNSIPLTDSEGNVTGMLSTLLDISARKRMEQALNVMSETQRQLFRLDNVADAIELLGRRVHEMIGEGYVNVSLVDESTRTIRVSGTHGYGDEGKAVLVRNGLDLTSIEIPLDAMTEAEIGQFQTERLELFSGRLYDLLARTLPRTASDAIEAELGIRYIYVIGLTWHGSHFGGLSFLTKNDLTPYAEMIQSIATQAAITINRIEGQEALRASESRYRMLAENMNDTVWLSDMSLQTLYISPSVTRLWGFTSDEMKVLPEENVIAPESASRLRKAIAEWIAPDRNGQENTPEAITLELEFFKKDGSKFWSENTYTLIRDDSGRPINILGTGRDITERRAAQQRQKELEEHLYRSQKLESIGTLASGVAHDFNNILTIIAGNAALLEGGCENAGEFQQRLASINQATDRGANVVRQLLTFARKTDASFQPVAVNDLVADTIHLLQDTFPRAIEFRTEFKSGAVIVNGDPNLLHQVLLNLCVNARDAMAGGGALTIATSLVAGEAVKVRHPLAGTGRYVLLRVTDTGQGMDEQTQARIFDPFFTTKGVGSGTGLGLAVVMGVVENMLGFIEVESSPGKGTAFSLYLPSLDEGKVQQAASSTRFDSAPAGTETILIVEDEPLAREMLADALGKKGYTVIEAGDGEEGFAKFEKHAGSLALVLSDLGLPKRDGESMCRGIREKTTTLPIVLMSGYIDPMRRDRLLMIPINAIVQKPYSPADIIRVIRERLDGK
jgi:two-component system, cell cycle sensor histidine kinase and response regulator CckA